MTINSMDAQEIALFVAGSFRTRVSHLRENLTTTEMKAVSDLCLTILESRVDDTAILNNQYDPKSDTVLTNGE